MSLFNSSNNTISANKIYGNLLVSDMQNFEDGTLGGWTANKTTSAYVNWTIGVSARANMSSSYGINMSEKQIGTWSGSTTTYVWIEKNYSLSGYSGDVLVRTTWHLKGKDDFGSDRRIGAGYIGATRTIAGRILASNNERETADIMDPDVWEEYSYYNKESPSSSIWVGVGAGTVLGSESVGYVFGSIFMDDVSVEIYGNDTKDGIYIESSQGNSITGNDIRAFAYNGIVLNISVSHTISGNNISTLGSTISPLPYDLSGGGIGKGIYLYNTNYSVISNNYASKATAGIDVSGHYNTISNNDVNWNVNRGIALSQDLLGYPMAQSHNNVISNRLLSNSGGTIYEATSSGIGVSRGTYDLIYNNSVSKSFVNGITLVAGSNHNVSQNYVTGSQFEIDVVYGNTLSTIADNTVVSRTKPKNGMNMDQYGISITKYGVGYNIIGNTIIGGLNGVYIKLADGTSDVIIANNILRNATRGIFFSGAGYNVKVRNNTLTDIFNSSIIFGDRDLTGFAEWTSAGLNEGHIGSTWSLLSNHPPYYSTVYTSLNNNKPDLLWTYNTSEEFKSTPIVGNNGLVIMSNTTLYALNPSTGDLIWSVNTNETNPDTIPGIGTVYMHSSPAISGDRVFVGAGNRTFAFNATTGARLWDYSTGGYVVSSPVVSYGLVYFGSTDGNIYAFNETNGNIVWSNNTGETIVSSPMVMNGRVVVRGWNKTFAWNNFTGSPLWTQDGVLSGGWASPVGSEFSTFVSGHSGLTGNYKYVIVASMKNASGYSSVYKLNATNGAILWTYPVSGDVIATTAALTDTISTESHLVATSEGYVYRLSGGGVCSDSVCKKNTGKNITSGVALSLDYFYYPTQNSIEAIYSNNFNYGGVLWNYTLNGKPSSISIAYDKIYVATDKGIVYAFTVFTDNIIDSNTITNASVGIDVNGVSVRVANNKIEKSTTYLRYRNTGFYFNETDMAVNNEFTNMKMI